jgi:hypothetical protein
MAHASGMGLRRNKPIPLYLSKSEKTELKKRAASADLSMAEYVRCKTFDIPFHYVGGKPKRERRPDVEPLTTPPEPLV